jgi:2-polyprenyl-3-methyl-5-hydroxy-6-metoxy-1,4-benzoquinol methylase
MSNNPTSELDKDILDLKEQADLLKNQGNIDKAVELYTSVLKLKPDYIEAHYEAMQLLNDNEENGAKTKEAFNEEIATVALAQAYAAHIQQLMLDGNSKGALEWCIVFSEFFPEGVDVWMMLGVLYVTLDRQKEAVISFLKALDLEPNNPVCRNYFINALMLMDVDFFDDRMKRWIAAFLKEPDSVDIVALSQSWHKVLMLDPELALLKGAAEQENYSSFKKFFEQNLEDIEPLILSDYFLDGLEYLIVPEFSYEIFLGNLRRWLLDVYRKEDTLEEKLHELANVLAVQCFNNEYVFFECEKETKNIEDIISAAEKGDLNEAGISILAMYRALFTIPKINSKYSGALKIFKAKGSKRFQKLIQHQVLEPAEESKLLKQIGTIEEIKDNVSKKVRQQYEENPYPRWTHIGFVSTGTEPALADILKEDKKADVLIAGCATGLHPIGVALKYPHTSITGIDLSRQSLSYAARKIKEYKIKNLNILQGDILSLPNQDKRFDYIESIGVLHHMDKPEKGWSALIDVLKPGGMMKIGLYSETARRYVVPAQQYIKDSGIGDSDDAIRGFRKEAADMGEGHEFKNLFKYYDMYTTSMCRDLLFHVQEHRYTIPKIKESLSELGLIFLGFTSLAPGIRTHYLKQYPEDAGLTNLENWEAFEKENPDSFLRMYIFLCKKG